MPYIDGFSTDQWAHLCGTYSLSSYFHRHTHKMENGLVYDRTQGLSEGPGHFLLDRAPIILSVGLFLHPTEPRFEVMFILRTRACENSLSVRKWYFLLEFKYLHV